MQVPRLRLADAALAISLLSSSATVLANQLDCAKISIDNTIFDLSKLSGPHSVVTSRYDPPQHINTTYTLDICRPLVKKGDACPSGTRACAIGHEINPGEGPGHGEITGHIIPLAGDLKESGGGDLDFHAELLTPGEASQGEAAKAGGLRLVLKGGAFPLDAVQGEKREQRVVVDFRCNKDLEGLEGEWPAEDKYETSSSSSSSSSGRLVGREEGKAPPESTKEKQLLKEALDKTALRFVSYGPEKGAEMLDVLRLTWETKHACAGAAGTPGDDASASSHWGLFTWLVIIVFLSVAAYLIFGSWLNYNRYGARGWDLLPHGDTIRDIPYLLKDWIRRVLNTVQGSGGSRGGYSAV